MTRLVRDCIEHVFSFLHNPLDLQSASLVNREWRSIITHMPRWTRTRHALRNHGFYLWDKPSKSPQMIGPTDFAIVCRAWNHGRICYSCGLVSDMTLYCPNEYTSLDGDKLRYLCGRCYGNQQYIEFDRLIHRAAILFHMDAIPRRLYRDMEILELDEFETVNFTAIESRLHRRLERYERLTRALAEQQLPLRDDSRLCWTYIMDGRNNVRDIVDKMIEVDWLYTHTDYGALRMERGRPHDRRRSCAKKRALERYILDRSTGGTCTMPPDLPPTLQHDVQFILDRLDFQLYHRNPEGRPARFVYANERDDRDARDERDEHIEDDNNPLA